MVQMSKKKTLRGDLDKMIGLTRRLINPIDESKSMVAELEKGIGKLKKIQMYQKIRKWVQR